MHVIVKARNVHTQIFLLRRLSFYDLFVNCVLDTVGTVILPLLAASIYAGVGLGCSLM
jgi:hypothetical protein